MSNLQNKVNSLIDIAFEESKLSTVYRFHNVTAITCGKGTNFNRSQ